MGFEVRWGAERRGDALRHLTKTRPPTGEREKGARGAYMRSASRVAETVFSLGRIHLKAECAAEWGFEVRWGAERRGDALGHLTKTRRPTAEREREKGGEGRMHGVCKSRRDEKSFNFGAR